MASDLPSRARVVVGCGGVREIHGTDATPAGLCVDCGVVTTHRGDDGLPRCGQLPKCAACRTPLRVTEPGQTTHPNCRPGMERATVITRELERLGLPYCTCVDLDTRDCPHCKEFAQRLEVAR